MVIDILIYIKLMEPILAETSCNYLIQQFLFRLSMTYVHGLI